MDPKAQLNFVTPASKETSPNVLEDKCADVQESDAGLDEPDSGIERLVDQSAVAGTPGQIKNPESVVDLTADNVVQPMKLTNVVSATKKRKPAAPKKKAPVVGINSVLAAIPPAVAKVVDTEEGKEPMGDVTSNDEQVASTEAVVVEKVSEAVAEAAESVDAVPMEVTTEAPAPVTPAMVVSKKRPRKASAKKLEAVESAALDPEQGASEDATEGAAPAAADAVSEEVKPTPKRVKKPATPKPVVVEIVYPPHVLVKQQANKDKLNALTAELLQLER